MKRFSVARSVRPLRFFQLFTTAFAVIAVAAATFHATADTQSALAIFNIDLGVTPPSITVLGASASDHLSGNGDPAVSSIFPRAHAIVTGDFNRDGALDIAIGAPDADFTPEAPGAPRPNAGAVYIIFGRGIFPANAVIDAKLTAGTQPEVKIFGAASGDNAGFALAAGDVNGDGGTDLIIGAPGFDPSTGAPATTHTDAGAAYILFGTTTLTAKTIDLSLANPANVVIFGEHDGDRFGSAIATGDVNGVAPATADLLIGAPASIGPDPANSARPDGGAAYLLTGGAGLDNTAVAIKAINLATAPAALRIYGKAASQLGSSVAIGDINSSGAGDIIVGAPKADRPNAGGDVDETGAVFAVFGGSNITPNPPDTSKVIDISQTQQNVSIYGETLGDHLGASISTGNLRGGGIIDLIMGAPDADGPADGRNGAGEAYILQGSTGLNTPNDPPAPGTPIQRRIDISLGAVNLTVYGASSGDHFGSTVVAGLVNTLGNTDLVSDALIGAPGFSSSKGAVYALFGGPNIALFAARDLAIGQDDLRVNGQFAGDELGWAIAAGDVDNNTGGDLIVGAPFADVSPSQADVRDEAGKVYVLLAGGNVVPPVNQNPTVSVTDPDGGEILAGGSHFEIKWDASDPDGNGTIQRFAIALSTDSGATFNTTIASNVAGDLRTFDWTVPSGINTTTARVRVTAFDDQGGSGSNASDANFTITDIGVGVTLVQPNGGETLIQGSTFTIKWTVPEALADQVKGFDLFLAPDGTNFTVQITAVNPTQPALPKEAREFPWVVPNLCVTTAKVLVRATSITNAVSTDISDAPFTIGQRGPTINVANGEIFFNSSGTKLNFQTTTINGVEVRFEDGVKLEISNDQAGTQFFEVLKAKKKNSGRKLQSKGKVNNLDVGVFFPDGATRIVRITNPTCGLTVLTLKRVGNLLVEATAPIDVQNVSGIK
jgi:FG-GAP repeat protein